MIILPHELKTEFMYEEGGFMVLVAKTNEAVFRFYWDGASVSYTKVKVNLRCNLEELSTVK